MVFNAVHTQFVERDAVSIAVARIAVLGRLDNLFPNASSFLAKPNLFKSVVSQIPNRVFVA